MGKFESRFYKFLEQDEQIPDQTPDQEAMVATLDPETNPDDLGADVNANAAKAIAQLQQK